MVTLTFFSSLLHGSNDTRNSPAIYILHTVFIKVCTTTYSVQPSGCIITATFIFTQTDHMDTALIVNGYIYIVSDSTFSFTYVFAPYFGLVFLQELIIKAKFGCHDNSVRSIVLLM